jgi:hypothetical protein
MSTNNSWNTPDLLLDGQLLIGQTGDRPLANVPTGEADEISITTGPGTVNIGIADNPIIPGNESITPTIGTTAQRPGVLVDGKLRFNSSLSVMECYVNGGWKNLENDSFVLARLHSNLSNVTGDGTIYQVVIPGPLTVDIRNEYNTTTGEFTPEVTGIYHYGGCLNFLNIGAAHTAGGIWITATTPLGLMNRLWAFNPAAIATGGVLAVNFSVPMLAWPAAPIALFVQIAGGTLTVSLEGNPGTIRTWLGISYISNTTTNT